MPGIGVGKRAIARFGRDRESPGDFLVCKGPQAGRLQKPGEKIAFSDAVAPDQVLRRAF